jgi:hypothetical protein
MATAWEVHAFLAKSSSKIITKHKALSEQLTRNISGLSTKASNPEIEKVQVEKLDTYEGMTCARRECIDKHRCTKRPV